VHGFQLTYIDYNLGQVTSPGKPADFIAIRLVVPPLNRLAEFSPRVLSREHYLKLESLGTAFQSVEDEAMA
jgi:hypothetical protein